MSNCPVQPRSSRGFAILLALSLAALGGCSAPRPELEVMDAFARATAPGQSVAAVYMVMVNNSDSDLVVNYLESPVADTLEVHRSYYDQGMTKMRKINHFTLARNSRQVFEPGGYHLMLIGIREPLEAGTSFPLQLYLNAGRQLEIQVQVRPTP